MILEAEQPVRRYVLDVSDRDRWLFHATPIPTIVIDRQGIVVEANAAACAKLAHGDRRALVGRPFATAAGLREPGALSRHLLRCTAARDDATGGATATATTELELTMADGEPWFVRAVSVGDASGGAVTSLVDRGEARMREERAAMVAHELRQSLHTITLYEQMVAQHRAGEARSAARVRAAVRAMRRMIDDLLDISLLESGRLPLHRERVAIREVVEAVVDRFAGTEPDRTVSLAVAADLPLVEIDRLRIEQVVGNLLSNAFKYGAPGTDVAIEVSPSPEARGAIEVAVTSEGPDIPADQLLSLFDRFYRTPAAARGDRVGLGLGLTICRGIVEAHGGEIWAQSGGGRTTLRFTLPR